MDVVEELVSHVSGRLLLYWGALVGGLWGFVQLGGELYEEGGLFFSMGGASILMLLTKVFLARERPALFPDVDLWQAASPSFPSGHATGSMAFFLTLYLVTRRCLASWHGLASVVEAVAVSSIDLSRLYLQVHSPSDIVAGWALAIGWVLAANSVHPYYRRDRTVRNVLLSLPTSIVKEYRAAAEREGIGDDEFVARALRHRLNVGMRAVDPQSHENRT